MNLLYIVLPSALILLAAYFLYGRLLARLFELNPARKTPAYELKDGLDFEPLDASSLVPQHFSAIAAAGPIVGPILAGLTFGWLPALIWILVGSIFIGVCLRYLKMPLGWATALFIVLVGAAIIAGPKIPLDLATLIYRPAEGAPADLYEAAKLQSGEAIATICQARKGWDVILLVYCLLAGMAPVRRILPPRGPRGGYFWYCAVGAGAI